MSTFWHFIWSFYSFPRPWDNLEQCGQYLSYWCPGSSWRCHQMETFSALLALCVGVHWSPAWWVIRVTMILVNIVSGCLMAPNLSSNRSQRMDLHDDIIKWKHYSRYWPFVPGIGEFPAQRPVTQSFAVFFDLCLVINGWVNSHEAGDLRRHCTDYDVIVMSVQSP